MKTNPSDSTLSLAGAIIRRTRAVLLPVLLAAGLAPNQALGYGTPVIDLQNADLVVGATTSWTNHGSAGGNFTNDSTTVNVASTAGKNSVTFTGANWMKASFTAPSSITGASPYTVVAQVYNPGIGGEEAYLCWAQRGTNNRCAQFNYGNATGYGAVTHFSADMGFANMLNNSPAAGMWHVIAITYDGTTEKLYVDGLLNNSGARALNLFAAEPVFLGTAYTDAAGATKAVAFSGSMASLQVYAETLAASDVKTLSGSAFITGQVTSGGTGVSGAIVYYKLSANASASPLGTVTADGSGNYTIALPQNTGTVYIAAGKTGYVTSADSSQSVATSDISGVNFSLTQQNTITGNVADGASVYNAAISVSTNPDGSAPSQTVYTDTSGNYTAYVNQNTTYYLICKKSVHPDSTVKTVAVVTSNVTGQNFTMTRNAAVKLVDVDAGGLTVGSQTTATTWANSGSLGGSFTANAGYTVLAAGSAGGRQAVQFANNVRFTSSWSTSAVTWPSALAGGDVQYSTVAWVYAPASTDTYLDWSTATGAQRGANAVSSSWMRYRYNNVDQWGESDHGSGTWMGWLGTNQASQATTPSFSTWHMIVNTYDGKSEKLYVDDVKKSNTTGDNTVRTFSPVANNMNIGGYVGASTFTGYINKIQVFDQALAQADIDGLWAAGNATNYTISGQVTSSGTGVSGATVNVYSDAGCTTLLTTSTTDGSGNYTTIGLPQSTVYYLKAGKAGYVTSGALTVNLGTANYTGANLAINVIPNATITGQVTESGTGTPLAGAKVYISASANASVSPSQVLTADGSGNYSASVGGGTWYICATDATHKTSADLTVTNADGSAQSGKSFALVADSANNIPQKSSLLFSVLGDSLPTTQGADTGNWAVYQPLGGSLAKQYTPTVDVLGGRSFAMNHVASADSFGWGSIAQGTSLPINGATIVTVVKPVRTGTVNNYQPVVSVLLGQLELCIRNGDGLLQVGRKGTDAPNLASTYYFADGVKHIVSYVVQPNGYFQVYVDGLSVWNYTATTADMTSITAQAWYATQINIGKGYNGDGWSSFNGDIADTLVYKTALTTNDRIALETSLSAKFGVTTPVYHTLACTAGTGGTINPSGSQLVTDGTSQTVTIAANVGYAIQDVTLDGASQGAVSSIALTNITADHTVAATFRVVPQHTLAGQVTDKTTGLGIAGATVYVSTSPNACLSSFTMTTTDGSGNYTITLYEGGIYVAAGKSGYYNSKDTSVSLITNVSGANLQIASNTRHIPRTGDIYFAAVTDNFPTTDGAAIGNWPRIYPDTGNMTAITTTNCAWVDNTPWMSGLNAGGTGYHALPSVNTGDIVTMNGGTIIVAVQPTLDGINNAYQDVVSVLLNRLSICINKGDGVVWVGRQAGNFGPNLNTGYAIPNGQKTILSLVVQPTGQSVLYANGQQIFADNTTADMTQLSTTSWWNVDINIGKGWNGDGWSSYNGKLGDVFVYKVALGDTDRLALESDLKTKFGILTHTITATAGTGGTINPSGARIVTHGTNQAFTIAAVTGYNLADVQVDGVSQGAIASYTFTNVTADHTITASFALQTFSISASAGTGGNITPNGATNVGYGGSQTYTITPSSGYAIQGVLVDGASNPGAVSTGTYTFANVTGNHTIAASFMTATPYNIWANGTFTNAFTDKDPTHNPDGDSLTNLQEFAFGTDPTTGNNGTIAYTGALLTSCGPPVARDMSPGTGGVDYRAVFCRRKNWQAEGLTYTVQFSADLDFTPGSSQSVTMDAGTGTVLATDAADVMEAVSVPYPLFIPVTGGYKKPTFFRVGVTSN